MKQMMARLRAMYGTIGSDILEETEAHKREASPPLQEPKEVPVAEDVLPLRSIRLEDVIKYCEPPQQQKQQQQAPIPTVVIKESEEDEDMTIPIRCHLKRRKSVGHDPMGVKRKKLLNLTPQELQSQELPKMKSTSPEVLKSAALSSHHNEEELDAFWNTLPRVEDTTGSTAAGPIPKERQE
ncbi:hypothetical protein Dimus_030492 [Dionaea muscipula]